MAILAINFRTDYIVVNLDLNRKNQTLHSFLLPETHSCGLQVDLRIKPTK